MLQLYLMLFAGYTMTSTHFFESLICLYVDTYGENWRNLEFVGCAEERCNKKQAEIMPNVFPI